jgi:Xaa-Pro aminopeptidase
MRLQKLRESIYKARLDGFIVMNPLNRRYISGFTGTSGILLVTLKDAYLITDFRYIEQARDQAPDFQCVRQGGSSFEALSKLLFGKGLAKLGFESETLIFKEYQDLSRALTNIELVPTRGLVEELRIIKEECELEKIQKAAQIGDEAFEHILQFIRPGFTERDVAVEFECILRRLGGEKSSFEIIVASGQRGALPHGVASDKVFSLGELVTVDFGVMYQGYASDCTRTLALGVVSPRAKEIYGIVLHAQEAGVEAVRAGMGYKELDELARNIIADAGYGDFFGHGLGHGVGMNVHELPTLSPKGEGVLKPGMVVTVEPGIYLPGWGGVRIEDLVVVRDGAPQVLTKFPKELVVLN